MLKRTKCLPRLMLLALAVVFVPLKASNADPPADQHGDIVVESVRASAAETGGKSILRFLIVNDGLYSAHFIGVETPVAKTARIMARVSRTEHRVLDSIGIPADDDLDLTTSHLWIKLDPLLRDLTPGDSIPIELVFAEGRVPAQAHVHADRR